MKYLKGLLTSFVAVACAVILVIGFSNQSAEKPIPQVAGQTIVNDNESSPTEPALPQPIYGPYVQNVSTDKPTSEPTPKIAISTSPVKKQVVTAPVPKKNVPKAAVTNSKSVTTSVSTSSSNCGGAYVQQFFCLLNQYRASKHLSPVSQNSGLAGVSSKYSQWMNSTGTFSHVGPDGDRLGDRCANAGITCRAENLAEGATSAKNLLDMWIASPAHNAILLGNYSVGGLGLSGAYATLLMN